MLTGQNFGPIMQGDTYRIEFALQDIDGTPLLIANIASAVILWYWARQPGGICLGEPMVATLLDDGDGEAIAQIQIITAEVGTFFYELEMTLSNEISTMATGSYRIEQQITVEAVAALQASRRVTRSLRIARA